MGKCLFEFCTADIGVVQRFHRIQALIDDLAVYQRLLDPGTQHTLAHGGFGLVQHPQQCPLLFPATHGFGQFQVGPGHGGKTHILGIGIILHSLDALGAVFLGFIQIAQQSAESLGHEPVRCKSAGFVPVGPELPGKHTVNDGLLVAVVLPQFHQGVGVLFDIIGQILQIQYSRIDEDFAGHVAAKLGDERTAHLFAVQLGGVSLAGRNIGKADAGLPAAAHTLGIDGTQIVVLVLRQHAAFDDCTRRDHTNDVPLDQSFGGGGVLHLFADSHLVALGNQAGHIDLIGMEGHAAHGGTFFLTAGLAGQGQFQFARSRQRIVIKHLIEIPYAVEKDFIGMLLLDIKILLHHGRYVLSGHASHS